MRSANLKLKQVHFNSCNQFCRATTLKYFSKVFKLQRDKLTCSIATSLTFILSWSGSTKSSLYKELFWSSATKQKAHVVLAAMFHHKWYVAAFKNGCFKKKTTFRRTVVVHRDAALVVVEVCCWWLPRLVRPEVIIHCRLVVFRHLFGVAKLNLAFRSFVGTRHHGRNLRRSLQAISSTLFNFPRFIWRCSRQ